MSHTDIVLITADDADAGWFRGLVRKHEGYLPAVSVQSPSGMRVFSVGGRDVSKDLVSALHQTQWRAGTAVWVWDGRSEPYWDATSSF
jgi:hypothetical protein